jgi:hypothetical protein
LGGRWNDRKVVTFGYCNVLLHSYSWGWKDCDVAATLFNAAKACITVGNLIIVAKINTTRTMKMCAPTNTTKMTSVQRKLWMETTATGTANRHSAEDLKLQKRR